MTRTVYLWHDGAKPPAELRITQVYGWLFDPHGRLVACYDNGAWGMPGGRPEAVDESHHDTLVREVDEEVQVRFTDAAYLGYQEVRRGGRSPVAQLRFVARITELLPRRPDPDHGRTHARLLAPVPNVLTRLDWGPSAEAQARSATAIAEARWALPVTSPTKTASLN
ncbi:NUDIX hydrolase [Spiractinospora alimapuensis]|uniref:NUDIX hydrolase n=1 Tax=Spiractinospora alimapuensis TaxID=2820884 RepID=UPI001F324E2D|nr:NUDIX hydrolase [Spiractinospora alimapuensis]QVQ50212.1 NUDIX hydrolase [Spiractinospora alimapuensis]